MKRKKLLSSAAVCFSALLFNANVLAVPSSSCLSISGGYAAENTVTSVTASLDNEISAAAFSVSLYFDPLSLEFVDASFNGKSGNFYFGDYSDDCVTFIWSDSKNYNLSGKLFTARFKTKSGTSGSNVPIDVGHAVYSNTSAEEIPFDVAGCEIVITSEYLWGDANGDGTVSVSDAVAINLFNVDKGKYPLSEILLINSDTDNNGIVDLNDCNNVLEYITKP